MMNDAFASLEKAAATKMNELVNTFKKQADEIMQELADAMNAVEQEWNVRPHCPGNEECANTHECKCNCDEGEEFQTVTLNEEEFCADDKPCEIVTLYAKNLDKAPCVMVEYDATMNSYSVLAAIIESMVFALHNSLMETGFNASVDAVRMSVAKNIDKIIMEAAINSEAENFVNKVVGKDA